MTAPDNPKWQASDAIGITLSGGGSRAVAFHLGTLDYLNRVDLLKNVEMLSSASGGSFITAKYSLLLSEQLREKKIIREENEAAYETFFDDFFELFFNHSYDNLKNTRAIEKVNESVGRVRASDALNYSIPSGRYSLFNIAADLYAESFLVSLKGKPYLLKELLDPPEGYPLKHVIFNATDYHNGVAFRFSSNPETYIGNIFLYERNDQDQTISDTARAVREACYEIRVADIVAASSCLPPLFEPMGFPDDFGWPEGKIPQALQTLCSFKDPDNREISRPIPLMDGGLYDNQAIESLMLADRGITLKELNSLLLADKWDLNNLVEPVVPPSSSQLGMFIVSDADRKDITEDKYEYNKRRNRRNFGNDSKGMSLGFAATLVFTVITIIWVTVSITLLNSLLEFGSTHYLMVILQLISWIGVSACYHPLLRWGRRTLKNLKKTPQVGRNILKGIFRLRCSWVIDALCSRYSSSISTIFDVLLKRTRDLGYLAFYGDTLYYKSRISNLLFRLIPGANTEIMEGAEEEWKKVWQSFIPSARLQNYIQHANNVGTRFWFLEEKPWEQPCLVAAGQATICFNLAQFIVRNYGGNSDEFPEDVLKIWKELVADWNRLNEDPYTLLSTRIPELERPD